MRGLRQFVGKARKRGLGARDAMGRHIRAIQPYPFRINRKRRLGRRNFPYFAPGQGSAITLLVRWKCPNRSSEWSRIGVPPVRQRYIPRLLPAWLHRRRRCIAHGQHWYSHRLKLQRITALRGRRRKGEYFGENAWPTAPFPVRCEWA